MRMTPIAILFLATSPASSPPALASPTATTQKAQQTKPAVAIDGFTPEQQFFIGWGRFRGDETRPETQRLMVQGDPHPVAKYRVIGPLSNLPEFAKTFGCKADAAMVRPADKRCAVW